MSAADTLKSGSRGSVCARLTPFHPPGLTSQQGGVIRQQVIEQLKRQIMDYDAEFRREEAIPAVGSHAKH